MAADVGYVEEQQPSTQSIEESTKTQVVTEEPMKNARTKKSKPRIISHDKIRSPDKQDGDRNSRRQSRESDSIKMNPAQKTDSNI